MFTSDMLSKLARVNSISMCNGSPEKQTNLCQLRPQFTCRLAAMQVMTSIILKPEYGMPLVKISAVSIIDASLQRMSNS